MTALIASALVILALAVLVGWALPAWVAKALLPALEGSGHLVTNYRGRRIPTGLGLVWVAWAVGALVVSTAGWFAFVVLTQHADPSPLQLSVAETAALVSRDFGMVVAPLVIGAALFGLVDDLFGDASAKGFRGHLSALVSGRLTTGGLKLLGIGLLALVYGLRIGQTGLGTAGPGWLPVAEALARAVLATLVIAFAANFVNLADLRPGRALKAYSLLAVIATVTSVATASVSILRNGDIIALPGGASSLVSLAVLALVSLVISLGPVVAVWRYDLGERAMLGDAGANAMGAYVGYVMAYSAPLWLLVVFAVFLAALNLASEKVSFSRVIERVRFLGWLDGLGRLPVGSEPVSAGDDGDRAGGPDSEGDDA